MPQSSAAALRSSGFLENLLRDNFLSADHTLANREKAHNLKDRSLEVIRVYRGLVDEDSSRPESGFAFYLDQAALVTLGVYYERGPRFGGGAYHNRAYHPILRRLEEFSDEPLRSALKHHEKRASIVLDLEEKVAAVVEKLKERGLVSPYLRSFVVARINPLRWIQGDAPPLEDVLKTMRERAAKFNIEKIRPQDLADTAAPYDAFIRLDCFGLRLSLPPGVAPKTGSSD